MLPYLSRKSMLIRTTFWRRGNSQGHWSMERKKVSGPVGLMVLLIPCFEAFETWILFFIFLNIPLKGTVYIILVAGSMHLRINNKFNITRACIETYNSRSKNCQENLSVFTFNSNNKSLFPHVVLIFQWSEHCARYGP